MAAVMKALHPARKPKVTVAETLDPLKKQVRKATLFPSTNNARLCPKRDQSVSNVDLLLSGDVDLSFAGFCSLMLGIFNHVIFA